MARLRIGIATMGPHPGSLPHRQSRGQGRSGKRSDPCPEGGPRRAFYGAYTLRRGAIERLLRRLGTLPVAQRAALPCLEPGRADIIIAGTAICLEVLDATGADELIVSDFGLREGIVLDQFRRVP